MSQKLHQYVINSLLIPDTPGRCSSQRPPKSTVLSTERCNCCGSLGRPHVRIKITTLTGRPSAMTKTLHTETKAKTLHQRQKLRKMNQRLFLNTSSGPFAREQLASTGCVLGRSTYTMLQRPKTLARALPARTRLAKKQNGCPANQNTVTNRKSLHSVNRDLSIDPFLILKCSHLA